jgi:hypothetical protein
MAVSAQVIIALSSPKRSTGFDFIRQPKIDCEYRLKRAKGR